MKNRSRQEETVEENIRAGSTAIQYSIERRHMCTRNIVFCVIFNTGPPVLTNVRKIDSKYYVCTHYIIIQYIMYIYLRNAT